MKTQRVDIWAAFIEDTPGGLTVKLNALAAAGANLEFMLARRAPDRPGAGIVFVTPIKGGKQIRAAIAAGFHKTTILHVVKLAGADKPGVGARITQALADAGLNLRGMSMAAIGKKFVCHVAVDHQVDAARVVRILRGL